ncbi:MAG: Holliday junction resolvase RuvX [Bacillota bacterium]|nr:Holliday junction resolvase RuvX [Bacillota bacterium]
MSKFMGLDIGDATIGIALSDENKIIALPYENYFRKSSKKDIEYLIDLCLEYDVEKIISGMPFNMNGTLGPQGEKTSKFITSLEKKIKYSDRISTDIETLEWDERLTSIAAEKAMLQADLSREKRKKNIDKIASTFILQGYLDYYNGGK